MALLKLQYERGKDELELLEQVYSKVKVGELVKLNGKAYKRVRPINNRYVAKPLHFYCMNLNIYDGAMLLEDRDGEFVSVLCNHKAIIL